MLIPIARKITLPKENERFIKTINNILANNFDKGPPLLQTMSNLNKYNDAWKQTLCAILWLNQNPILFPKQHAPLGWKFKSPTSQKTLKQVCQVLIDV